MPKTVIEREVSVKTHFLELLPMSSSIFKKMSQ